MGCGWGFDPPTQCWPFWRFDLISLSSAWGVGRWTSSTPLASDCTRRQMRQGPTSFCKEEGEKQSLQEMRVFDSLCLFVFPTRKLLLWILFVEDQTWKDRCALSLFYCPSALSCTSFWETHAALWHRCCSVLTVLVIRRGAWKLAGWNGRFLRWFLQRWAWHWECSQRFKGMGLFSEKV